jgi:hypothetical protein
MSMTAAAGGSDMVLDRLTGVRFENCRPKLRQFSANLARTWRASSPCRRARPKTAQKRAASALRHTRQPVKHHV